MALRLQSRRAMQTRTQRLLHRWFVEYNPFYLLSAVFVLFGVTLISRALASESSLWGHLVVGGVTELYAFALVFGAALLTRIGLRRPAVFVALIAVLYQGDLTLGTEANALFGRTGELVSFLWFVSFVAKLHALAWALKLRLSRSAAVVPSFAAAGLATIPHLSRRVDAHSLTTVVGLWVFGVFAAASWTSRTVTSRVALDAWGSTVLRRSTRAAWTLWAGLTVAHVLFWTSQFHLRPHILAPVALLLATRWIRGEIELLAAISATLVFVGVVAPDLFQTTALASAIVLSLHALRAPSVRGAAAPEPHEVYRGAHAEPEVAPVEVVFARLPSAALARTLAWAGYSLYLSAWTSSWSGGAWPTHVVTLDVLLAAAVVLSVWKTRQRVVSLPVVATYVHWSIQSRLVRAPQSTLQWGIATVAVGFGLLLSSLIVSWRLQRPARDAETRRRGT